MITTLTFLFSFIFLSSLSIPIQAADIYIPPFPQRGLTAPSPAKEKAPIKISAKSEIKPQKSDSQKINPHPKSTGDLSVKKTAKKRNYKIYVRLREEYDDNFLNADREVRSRFQTIFGLGAEGAWKWRTGDLRANYEFGMNYYEDRRSKPFDDYHQLSTSVNQQVGSNGTLFWNSLAKKTDEPMIVEGDRRTRRRENSYLQSKNSGGIRQDWSKSWQQEFSAGIDRSEYDDPFYRLNLNRNQYWNFNSLKYSGIPDWVISSDFRIAQVNYDFIPRDYKEFTHQNSQRYLGIKNWVLLSEMRFNDLDYQFLSADNSRLAEKAGFEWTFIPKHCVGLKAGPVFSFSNDSERALGHEINSFYRGDLNSKLRLETTYAYGEQPSLINFYIQQYHQFQNNLRYQIIEKWKGSFGINYQISNYTPEVRLASNRLSPYRESILSLDQGWDYELSEGFNLECKHGYIIFDSSNVHRDYERNRVSVGIRISY